MQQTPTVATAKNQPPTSNEKILVSAIDKDLVILSISFTSSKRGVDTVRSQTLRIWYERNWSNYRVNET